MALPVCNLFGALRKWEGADKVHTSDLPFARLCEGRISPITHVHTHPDTGGFTFDYFFYILLLLVLLQANAKFSHKPFCQKVTLNPLQYQNETKHLSRKTWNWRLTELIVSHKIYIVLRKKTGSYNCCCFPLSDPVTNMHFSSILIFHYSLQSTCCDLVLLWSQW